MTYLLSLQQAAQKGDWTFVDNALRDEKITSEIFEWAIESGLKMASDDERDLAASILNASSKPLSDAQQAAVFEIMMHDSYEIVRMRLALALYQRGDRRNDVLYPACDALMHKDLADFAHRVLRIK